MVVIQQGTAAVSDAGVSASLHGSGANLGFPRDGTIVGRWVIANFRGNRFKGSTVVIFVVVGSKVLEGLCLLGRVEISHSNHRQRAVIDRDAGIVVELNVGRTSLGWFSNSGDPIRPEFLVDFFRSQEQSRPCLFESAGISVALRSTLVGDVIFVVAPRIIVVAIVVIVFPFDRLDGR